MSEPSLRIRLFGPFALSWAGGEEIDLRSAKLKALLALLATAPDGMRTRSWLQDMLWSLSGPLHGRASLRQALSNLRRELGAACDLIVSTTNETVRLRQTCFTVVGVPADGEFLEGLDIAEEGFSGWLREQRSAPVIPKAALPPATVAPPPPERHAANGLANAAAEVPSSRIVPIVAVIPFSSIDLTSLAPQLGDAVAQDVTRSLSRSPFLHVISHLSSRDQRLKNAGLAELRGMLDADFVVCGQVRLVGERFRLDVDFVDASDGRLRWTRDFSGLLPNFLAGSDEVVQCITTEIMRTILTSSLGPVANQPLPSLASHTLLMSAITLMHRQALGSFAKARACLEELIHRSPQYAVLHAWLAKWYVLSINQGWSADVVKDAQIAKDNAQRAIEADPTCSFSLAIDGLVHHYWRDIDHAFAQYEEALATDPNNALAWLLKGTLHAFIDEGDVAVANTGRARALSPLDPQSYYFDSLSATAHLAKRDYDGALSLAEHSLQLNRRHTSTLRVRTIALQMLGREADAKVSATELLRHEPTLTVNSYVYNHPAAQYRTGQEWAYALRSAGIPQN